MRRTLVPVVTVLSLAATAGLAAGAEYSVSPAGSDASACTRRRALPADPARPHAGDGG